MIFIQIGAAVSALVYLMTHMNLGIIEVILSIFLVGSIFLSVEFFVIAISAFSEMVENQETTLNNKKEEE